jgi:hypothetical protein
MPLEYAQFNAEKVDHPQAEVNGLDVRTLTGDVTLSERDGRMHIFNNGGAARNVTLWTTGIESRGRVDMFHNSGGGAFSLAIKDSSGTTIATIAQNASCMVVSNGTLHIRAH